MIVSGRFTSYTTSSVTTRTLGAKSFTLGDLVHEVGLLLLKIRGESLILGTLDSGLDSLALLSALSFLFFLDGLGHTAVVSLQGLAEFGIGLSLVVKVNCICCRPIERKIRALVMDLALPRTGPMLLTEQSGDDCAGRGGHQNRRPHYGGKGV